MYCPVSGSVYTVTPGVPAMSMRAYSGQPCPDPSVTVPVMVTGSGGPSRTSWTEARASSRPSPHTLLLTAVPPHWRSDTSWAAMSSASMVASMLPMKPGPADHMRATVPATWGDAIDVPLALP